MQLDTGSAQTWAFSTECKGCGTLSFDPKRSSTLVNTSEPSLDKYGSGDHWASGWRVKETVQIGSVTSKGVLISIMDSQAKMGFEKQAGGITGWSWPGYHDSNGKLQTPLPYVQAVTNKQWSEPTFGLYLNRKNDRALKYGTQSKGDGALTLGGVDSNYFTGQIAWAPRKELNQTWWTVDFPSIVINGQRITLPSGSAAALDSGTTTIRGPLEQVKQFYSNIPGAQDNGDGTWTVDCKRTDIKASFNVGGVDWPTDPTDLVFPDGTRCIGTVSTLMASKDSNTWFLGGAFLKNVYTAWRYDPPAVGLAKLKDGL